MMFWGINFMSLRRVEASFRMSMTRADQGWLPNSVGPTAVCLEERTKVPQWLLILLLFVAPTLTSWAAGTPGLQACLATPILPAIRGEGVGMGIKKSSSQLNAQDERFREPREVRNKQASRGMGGGGGRAAGCWPCGGQQRAAHPYLHAIHNAIQSSE